MAVREKCDEKMGRGELGGLSSEWSSVLFTNPSPFVRKTEECSVCPQFSFARWIVHPIVVAHRKIRQPEENYFYFNCR